MFVTQIASLLKESARLQAEIPPDDLERVTKSCTLWVLGGSYTLRRKVTNGPQEAPPKR